MSLQIHSEWLVDGQLPDAATYTRSEIELAYASGAQALRASLRRAFAALRCPAHGDGPRFTLRGCFDSRREEMDFHIEVETCCEAFLQEVQAQLHQQASR